MSHDIPLFEGITSDLFPGIVLPRSDHGVLEDAMLDAIARMGFKDVPWFVDKIIQIYEMMLVRHGFMIVGGPLAGKTSAYKVLAITLGELHDSQLMEEFKVDYM